MYSTETNLLVWKQRLSHALKDTLKEAKQQPRIDSIFTPLPLLHLLTDNQPEHAIAAHLHLCPKETYSKTTT